MYSSLTTYLVICIMLGMNNQDYCYCNSCSDFWTNPLYSACIVRHVYLWKWWWVTRARCCIQAVISYSRHWLHVRTFQWSLASQLCIRTAAVQVWLQCDAKHMMVHPCNSTGHTKVGKAPLNRTRRVELTFVSYVNLNLFRTIMNQALCCTDKSCWYLLCRWHFIL